MEYMSTAEIREKYLAYFENKGCKRMPSSSLIPDDPSLLLTAAGMVQFKPYFLQQKHLEEPYIGATTVQKCVRTNDIENIGVTGRHLSFFEMLGNFSFGEYFKKEMCAWAFDFSVNVLGLPKERLYFTVFEDDDETIEIWKGLGVEESHISKLGEDDNFWRAGPTGPCGPCSELYFDQGEDVGCGSPDCAPGCDCDRFLEYWNCVFTQYDGQEDGSLVPLPKKNIDTGMGLERMAAIMQGVTNNYETDVLRTLVGVGERLCKVAYGQDSAVDRSLRIMADHSRSVTFMIADGILPSNEGRGYVLRRLLRRAVMKAHLLGLDGPFLNEYVDEIVRLMGSVYPEIVENRELTRHVILSEEERFGATLKTGKAYLEQALDQIDGSVLDGAIAFTLHDTYGFPVEVTQEICETRNVSVDMDAFAACMDEQKARARANAKDADNAWGTFDGAYSAILEECKATTFVGYDNNDADADVLAIIADGKRVGSLHEGETGELFLNTTPFYAEKGGQVGDTGYIESDGFLAEVQDTKEPEKGLHCHKVTVKNGQISVGDKVRASIDVCRRERIRRNHTATHILHWALREVLGDHVKQAGSYVAPNRLRFDFTHYAACTPEEVAQVERLANQKIMEAHNVNTFETSLDEARKMGVIALFGEKYGERVRVVDADEFSQELCGGTHVTNTSQIGLVKIVSESGVGANLRRIEAVTSYDALEYVNAFEAQAKETAALLKCKPTEIAARTQAQLKAYKELQSSAKKQASGASNDAVSAMVQSAQTAKGGYQIVFANVGASDAGTIRNTWDVVRSRLGEACAAVLAAENDGKPLLLAAGSDKAVEMGFNAKEIINAIGSSIQGGGGGKPTMAQAGGKKLDGLDDAIAKAQEILC